MKTILHFTFFIIVLFFYKTNKVQAQANLQWAKNMGVASADNAGGVVLDASGNSYTTGRFSGTADFDPSSASANLTSVGRADVYISKLDATGNYVWAKRIGGTGSDEGFAIKTDASNNIYITGSFEGTVDFDPNGGTTNLSSNGNVDIFILKLDASGNFVWAKSMGGSSSDLPTDMTLDASGNIYTTGRFFSTVDFDPGLGTANLSSAGGIDIFVSKLDASGNYVWAKSMGGSTGDISNAIAVDASGNVYTTGYYTGTADFDPSTGTSNLTAIGTEDIFVSKLTSTGNFSWIKGMGSSSSDQGTGIVVDASNVYITGFFSGTADFNPNAGTLNLTSNGGVDIFVCKLSNLGIFSWANSIGGTNSDIPNAITLDPSGNVVLTGNFINTVDFDPSAATANLTAVGSNDIFVYKLSAAGTYLWAKNMGGGSIDFGNAIAIRANGDIYTTGTFRGTVNFNPGSGTFNLTSLSRTDIFLSKLDASGNFVLANQISSSNINVGRGIAVDAAGSVYTTGNFRNAVDFNPSSGTNTYVSEGSDDIFISKLDSNGNYIWDIGIGSKSSDIAYAIAADANGYLYIVGSFTDTVDFNFSSATTNLISKGAGDIFICKIDTAGNFIWAKAIGGTGLDRASAIGIDATGNVYVAGSFRNTADFDPGAGIANLTAIGASDIFILKLDVAGNYIWAKGIGDINIDIAVGIALDANANVYTIGSFNDAPDFDPGAGTFKLISLGSNDVFVSKLDAGGNFVWAKQVGGTNTDLGRGIDVDANGNVYITGSFNNTADFDPGVGTANLVSNGGSDIFMAKLNASGNYVWSKGIGDIANDDVNAITKDGAGNIYTTGSFQGTIDFNPGASIDTLSSKGLLDFFISKYDTAGNYLWVAQFGGIGNDNALGIIVDTARNIYTTGTFSSMVDFDPSSVGQQSLTSIGANDIFILKMSQPAGNPFGIENTNTTINNYLNTFPNPANDKLTVKWNNEPNNERSQIVINDLSGRAVWRSELFPLSVRETEVNLQKIPVGFYTITLVGDSKRASTKLIIAR